jgi:hypothetical protein
MLFDYESNSDSLPSSYICICCNILWVLPAAPPPAAAAAAGGCCCSLLIRTSFLYDSLNLPAVINEAAVQTLLANMDRCTKNFYMYLNMDTNEWFR